MFSEIILQHILSIVSESDTFWNTICVEKPAMLAVIMQLLSHLNSFVIESITKDIYHKINEVQVKVFCVVTQ
jgi:hypothetical protein